MDNNMIHIDDLVRQRLRGGEEPERPGAWLTMRELLDKEMPVATGTNWRRIIGYFSALLLLSTASVGGYRMYNNYTSTSQVASGGGRNEEGTYATVSGPTANGRAIPEESAVTHNTNSNTSSNSTESTPASASVNTSSDNGNYLAANVHKPVATRTRSNHISRSAKSGTVTDVTTTSTDVAVAPVKHASPSANGGADPMRVTSASPGSSRTNRQSADELQSLDVAGSQAANTTPADRPAPSPIRYETIERLELVHHKVYDAGTDKTYYRIDTFPMGRFVREVTVSKPEEEAVASNTQPVATPEKNSAGTGRQSQKPTARPDAKSTPAIAANTPDVKPELPSQQDLTNRSAVTPPATSLGTKTAEEEVGASVAAMGSKAAHSGHFRLWDSEKVQEAIEKAKISLSRIQMYPGVMAGINASMFTPNALGGFQVGLTSLFALNDWWSVMVEMKYIHRFNTGSSIRDDYKNVISGTTAATTINGQPYTKYEWSDQTVKHSFNYDVVRTFEFPLMLRRNWSQFYAQGGLNLVFSSKIAASEVTNMLPDTAIHVDYRPGGPHTPAGFVTNDKPTVQISDFGTRFGTGYVLSAGWSFSPSVYVDGRITGTFWDNSKTDGAKQISKDLLRTPSIQLSVGYRFNAKN